LSAKFCAEAMAESPQRAVAGRCCRTDAILARVDLVSPARAQIILKIYPGRHTTLTSENQVITRVKMVDLATIRSAAACF
jgi:hypothetical protein